MICCAGYPFHDGGETVFDVEASRIKYGSGALREVGEEAKTLGMRRVMLVTDAKLAKLPWIEVVRDSLVASGCDVVIYDDVHVEPTNTSFRAAADFARAGEFDGYVSVGGGSAIDTAKAANLYATWPADFYAYVNAPIGEARAVPGPLRPHIACPTTCGTGAEVTAIAIFDDLDRRAKTGIVSRRIRPSLGVIDPDVTASLPSMVVACSGFDVLAHALESFTARPYTARAQASAATRPLSQGANPFSDVAAREAMRLLGTYLVRAVQSAADLEARERLMFAATLAGIGFGNAGVHIPHAMSYAIGGLVPAYRAPDYPADTPIVPHGMAVVLSVPAVARFTAETNPERHLEAASLLGAQTRNLHASEGGAALAGRIEALMRATAMPAGIGAVGFTARDIAPLRDGTLAQARLLSNAPRLTGGTELEELFAAAM